MNSPYNFPNVLFYIQIVLPILGFFYLPFVHTQEKLFSQRKIQIPQNDSCDVKSYHASVILEKRRIGEGVERMLMGGLLMLWTPKGRTTVEG